MSLGNLPPQAYTRETLKQAFHWLKDQPDNIKKMVQDSDTLVALYLRSVKFGANGFDESAPVSSQQFKQGLKDLAANLREFEPERDPLVSKPEATNSLSTPTPAVRAPKLPTAQEPKAVLDEKSWRLIHESKEALNLSSDSETLRLLITLGHRSLKKILNN